jgi:hypothetical protein
MNIESLLRSLRQAKKLRKVLPFHDRAISGIDVPNDEYPAVQAFIKVLFKSLKSAGFDICVNHWGEITLSEPVHKIKVDVSVSYPLDEKLVQTSVQKLKNKDYLPLPEDSQLFPAMVCQFKLLRNGTKRHSFKLDAESMKGEILAAQIRKNIQERAAMLNTQVNREFCDDRGKVSIEDILALIRYAAAAFGKSSSLYSLSTDKHTHYPGKIVFENANIQIINSHSSTYKYLLKSKELKLFQLMLPISADNKIEVDL